MADTVELPDIAICQILHSLSTKFAVRASILSKQWERVWPLVPVLDFDEDENAPNGHNASPRQHRKFLEFVTMCLKRREEDKLLHKFWLRMAYCYYCRDCAELMDKCLSFALDRNVIELHIAKSDYFLPHKVLNAECLTVLSMDSIQFRGDETVTLPSLKSLSLICISFGDLGFHHLVAGCPSLENLSVVKCTGFEKRVIVKSSTLKSLEVFNSGVELQVEALNLETFRFGQNGHASNYRRLLCNIQFSSCGALRNLAFFQAWFVGAWFDNLSSKFPVLESLILYKCGIDRGDLKVFSKNLKHFVL
ncbi:PREDICTED: F-box/LRR-repeat protein 13-like [Fragaria vesca subsp. vesca]|uniref:F-box/LRR-repeat protein 13-like n=1 Tax=Fragaria vesca subsp. vesca TaxID=101020 RepID=UPI0002C313BF|nr:PREDICTED: F-box/LRR-repeat protein 13-like [Fragaria vesca subsp. vesca]